MFGISPFSVRNLGPPRHHGPGILSTTRAVAAQVIEAMTKIDVIAAKSPLREDRCNTCGEHASTFSRSIGDHTRQPRWQRQSAQCPALLGDTARGIDGADFGEECSCFAKRALRGRIEKSKLAWVGRAPLGQIEQERGQVGGQYLRARVRLECTGLRFIPQAIANTPFCAARSAAPLVGCGARYAHCLESCQTDVW